MIPSVDRRIGAYRPFGAIRCSGRGAFPPEGSAALGETPGRVEGVPKSAASVDTPSPNAETQPQP